MKYILLRSISYYVNMDHYNSGFPALETVMVNEPFDTLLDASDYRDKLREQFVKIYGLKDCIARMYTI